MTHRGAVAWALVAVAATLGAWALAYPQGALGATAARTLADCAAVVTLGLAAVPLLDGPRYRDEVTGRAAAPLTAAAAVWVLAELTRMIVGAAQAAALPLGRLGAQTTVDFALDTASGRAGLLAVAAAALVGAAAIGAPRSTSSTIVVTGIAAVGVMARQLTGHFADSAVGGLAVAAHTMAAALWCGVLAGLVLTVSQRGQWARMLPRFSALSGLCVVVLLAGGAMGAAVRLGAPAELYTTGYGRVLSAKVATTAALVVLGWRNRTMWLPAARAHRASAQVSGTRSRVELILMVAALALAAGLAVTG